MTAPYVAAVVLPHERTFASGAANLAGNIFRAVGSSVVDFIAKRGFFGSLSDRMISSAPLVIE